MRRERITSAMLGDAVAALNRELGRQPGTPGAYGILGAYDGWQLATFAAAGAGSVDHVALPVGHGYHPRRAVYDAVQAIRHGLALGRQAGATADAVAVHVQRADAVALVARHGPLTIAAARSGDWAFYRLADAIAAAVRQEGPAL